MALDEVGAGDFAFDDYINYIVRRQANRPVCRLTLTGAIGVTASSNTPVAFGSGTEVLDDRGWHSISTNTSRVVPDLAGRYLVQANVTWAASASGARRSTFVYKNTGLTAVYTTGAPGSITLGQNVGDVLEANGTTDYFQLGVFQDTAGSLNILGTGDSVGSTVFTVTFLGDSL